jgi:hypothetical protein
MKLAKLKTMSSSWVDARIQFVRVPGLVKVVLVKFSQHGPARSQIIGEMRVRPENERE